jgi:hypothetical protein
MGASRLRIYSNHAHQLLEACQAAGPGDSQVESYPEGKAQDLRSGDD